MSGHHHDHGGTGKTVVLNLAVNIVLTLAKWAAFLLTGSPSLFGEAAHSTADSLNPVLLWTGHRRGRRPRDGRHPFGHGRETFFWSLIAAQMMLLIGSFLTAYHGIETIVTGRSPEYSSWSLGIMAFALAAEGYTFTLAWLRLRQEKGATIMEKIGRSHNTVLLGVLLENGVDALAVVLAFTGFGLFVLTGNPLWDAVFSLLIAATLAVSSLFLINRNRSLIIGEAAPEAEKALRAALCRPSVRAIEEAAAITTGADTLLCRASICFDASWLGSRYRDLEARSCGPADPAAWAAAETVMEIRKIRSDIEAALPDLKEIAIDLRISASR